MTWGQARRRGYTKKNWNRAKKISKSLKIFHKRKKKAIRKKKLKPNKIWHVRLEYKSPRGRANDIFFEVYIVEDNALSAKEIQKKAIDYLQSNSKELGSIKDFADILPFEEFKFITGMDTSTSPKMPMGIAIIKDIIANIKA